MNRIIYKYQFIHEIGKRSSQEDSIFPFPGMIETSGNTFIICDGMGGHDYGEVASQAVCHSMGAFLTKYPNESFETALSVAYDALDEVDAYSERKMGTTLAFLKFMNDHCVVANIGDSRIYHIRPSENRILFVTKDHSLASEMVASGLSSFNGENVHDYKNVLTKVMQPHQEIRTNADVTIITDIIPGDYFYICSDGMLETMTDAELVDIISSPHTDKEKCDSLRNATANNDDNHSAFIIHVCGKETEGPFHLAGDDKKKRIIIALLVVIVSISLLLMSI